MKLLRKRDMQEQKYTNAFLGYGPEDAHFVVELTYSNSVTNLLAFLIITYWTLHFVKPVLHSWAVETVLLMLVFL